MGRPEGSGADPARGVRAPRGGGRRAAALRDRLRRGRSSPWSSRARRCRSRPAACASGCGPRVDPSSRLALLAGRAPALAGSRSRATPPFAGDRRLLATVSPNGDGSATRRVVRFRLTCRRRCGSTSSGPTRPVGRPQTSAVSRSAALRRRRRSSSGDRRATPSPGRILRLRLTAGGRVYTNGPDSARPGRAGRARAGHRGGLPAAQLRARRARRPEDRHRRPEISSQVFQYTSQARPAARPTSRSRARR